MVESWIAWMTANTGCSRAEVAIHVREEHSTFGWVMEGLIERTGCRIAKAEHSLDVSADHLAERPARA